MDIREFISRVVPDDGFYILATIDSNGVTRHTKIDSLDGVASRLQLLNNTRDDIYFATGSYADRSKGRTKNNVKSKKALYLDLDCGPGKAFDTQAAATRELHAFTRATKLPFPNILLSSGNGVHVYWSFDKPVDVTDWYEAAEALKELCVASDFPADSVVTSDSTRIMRAPDSLNYKDPAKPKLCRILGTPKDDIPFSVMRRALKSTAGPGKSVPNLTLVPTTGAPVTNDDLGTPRVYEQPPIEKVFARCATLKYALDTSGEEGEEAIWQQMLHVLAHLPDGHEYAHKISNKYPTYSAKETDEKFAEKLAVVKNGGTTGPTSCNTFMKTPGNHCDQCPVKGKVKNPLLAATLRIASDMPYGYEDKQDGTYMVLSGGDGEPDELIRLTKYRFTGASINIPHGEAVEHFRCVCFVGSSTPRNIELPVGDLSDPRKAAVTLGSFNMAFKQREMKAVIELMVDWATQMQQAKCFTNEPNKLGWTKRGRTRGFALARQVIWPDGEQQINQIPNLAVNSNYTPCGDLDTWKKAAELIVNHPNIELQVALASAFAAPLMAMTNTPGAVLAIVSHRSGIGKSKALQTAQAVWGKPTYMNSMDDTQNSIMKKMGTLNNLPAYWDELQFKGGIGNVRNQQFVDALFRIAQGTERSRLDANIQERKAGTWSTLITIASNDSLKDHIRMERAATDAGAMRLLELDIGNAKEGQCSVSMANRIFGSLAENYGYAGVKYATYLTENYQKVDTLLQGFQVQFENSPCLHGTASSQRMRLAAAAALVCGASLAKAIGLVNFDVKAISERIKKELTPTRDNKGKAVTDHISVNDALMKYQEVFARHVNKSNIFATPGNKIANIVETISHPDQSPTHIHYADSLQRMRIDAAHFRDWVTQFYGSGGSRLLAELKALPTTTMVRTTLDQGLLSCIDTMRRRLLEIDVPSN